MWIAVWIAVEWLWIAMWIALDRRVDCCRVAVDRCVGRFADRYSGTLSPDTLHLNKESKWSDLRMKEPRTKNMTGISRQFQKAM